MSEACPSGADARGLDDVSPKPERRQLLLLEKPPKPISQMSDAEREEFAARLVDLIFLKMGKPPREDPHT